jgi:hypothetical protein
MSPRQIRRAAERQSITSMAQHRWLLDRATRLQETTLDPETGQITDPKLFSLYLHYATTEESAKGAAARRHTREELQGAVGGKLDTAAVLRVFLNPFHKCLSTLLTYRIQKEKSQIGFESQKRKSDLHELKLGLKTMQYTDQQRRFYANLANGLPPEAQKFMDQAA